MSLIMFLLCATIGVYVSFSYKQFKVKEFDGYVAIDQDNCLWYRKFPIQIVAKSFVPTRFNIRTSRLVEYD